MWCRPLVADCTCRAASWDAGFGNVTLNGRQLTVGSTVSDEQGLSVQLLSAYQLTVSVGNFDLQLDNSDRFINIVGLKVHDWKALSSHGLLGQTWRHTRKQPTGSHIEGDVDEYVEKSGDLFGSDLVYGVDSE